SPKPSRKEKQSA
ncbi:hypothetical protein ADUPG1_003797, partial [Aduncisulcus paluster]